MGKQDITEPAEFQGNMADSYWAQALPTEIGAKLFAKVENAKNNTLLNGLNQRSTRAYQFYYGLDPSGIHATSQILRGGDAGELAELRVNHARSLINTLLNLIVAPKIVWHPKATNVDYDSLRETELASAILDYYWSEQKISKYAVQALEEALVFTEGFVLMKWDGDAGDDYAMDPDAPDAGMIKSGDVHLKNVSTWDVIRDPAKTSWETLDWVIVRCYENKYNLIAKYPEFADLINTATDDRTMRQTVAQPGSDDTDDVALYYFYHKPTAALPTGRQTAFLNNKAVLADGPLAGGRIPLFRVSAGELIGTPYGYSSFLDVLGIQEIIDSLHTAVTTNQTTLATQCISAEAGSDIPIDQLPGGMKVIYHPPGGAPPRALQLTSTPPEVFKYLEQLQADQQLIFGLNSVVRGETPSGELSGSALALLQSQALQQSSTIQANYLRMVEELGQSLLRLVRDNLDVPRTVSLVGKSSSYLVTDAEFVGSDLSRIQKVQVEIGNPLAATPAGRAEMAKELLTLLGPKFTVEQYQQVLATGRLEPLTKSLNDELLLIRAENEQLTAGELPPVVIFDDHLLHVREHRSVLANLEARKRPEVLQAALAHIAEHETQYYTAPPTTLMMMGQQPPMLPMGPTGGDPSVPAGGSKPAGNPNAGDAQMPNNPTNPATGQTWDPTTGGGVVGGPGPS